MRKLVAEDGKYYTQAASVPAEKRVFATVVYLGKFDKEENWRLADQEEKERVEAEVKASMDHEED